MGLLVGTTFYPVISVTKRHRLIMWSFRLLAIPLAVILYVVLTRNFYTSNPYAGTSPFSRILCSCLLRSQPAPGVAISHASRSQQIIIVKGKSSIHLYTVTGTDVLARTGRQPTLSPTAASLTAIFRVDTYLKLNGHGCLYSSGTMQ